MALMAYDHLEDARNMKDWPAQYGMPLVVVFSDGTHDNYTQSVRVSAQSIVAYQRKVGNQPTTPEWLVKNEVPENEIEWAREEALKMLTGSIPVASILTELFGASAPVEENEKTAKEPVLRPSLDNLPPVPLGTTMNDLFVVNNPPPVPGEPA